MTWLIALIGRIREMIHTSTRVQRRVLSGRCSSTSFEPSQLALFTRVPIASPDFCMESGLAVSRCADLGSLRVTLNPGARSASPAHLHAQAVHRTIPTVPLPLLFFAIPRSTCRVCSFSSTLALAPRRRPVNLLATLRSAAPLQAKSFCYLISGLPGHRRVFCSCFAREKRARAYERQCVSICAAQNRATTHQHRIARLKCPPVLATML